LLNAFVIRVKGAFIFHQTSLPQIVERANHQEAL